MSSIRTSNITYSTAYSNQRKVSRCQNGVLWTFPIENSANTVISTPYYSTNNGSTWTADTAGYIFNASGSITDSHVKNISVFIDIDDYAHAAFKDNSNGFIYYRRGTPNAGRTSWTWSAAEVLQNIAGFDYPDVVAHKEGSGWQAHCIYSYLSGANNVTTYRRVSVASNGALAVGAQINLSEAYNASLHTFPSIDFNHTGDGKTVKSSTPHIYTSWSAGAGKGIRFKKLTYSGLASWTVGAERIIDPNNYVLASDYWQGCLFDGTALMIAGRLYDGSVASTRVYERNEDDTTTTTRVNVSENTAAYAGSFCYDSSRNIYIVGGTNVSELVYRKWNRQSNVFDNAVVIANKSNDISYVTAKRNTSAGRIELMYLDGTASPYDVKYESVALNVRPNAPSGISASGNRASSPIIVSWTHNDPEGDPQIGAEIQVREPTMFIRHSGSHSTSAQSYAIPAYTLKSGAGYEVRVRTSDAGGFGAWSAWIPFAVAGRVPGLYYFDGTELQTVEEF